jgi:hypothetical protein
MTEETKDLTGMLNVEVLLIRAVSAIVSAYAEEIASASGGDLLEIEADFYRSLEVNCRQKAEMAKAFAAARPSQ